MHYPGESGRIRYNKKILSTKSSCRAQVQVNSKAIQIQSVHSYSKTYVVLSSKLLQIISRSNPYQTLSTLLELMSGAMFYQPIRLLDLSSNPIRYELPPTRLL